MGGGLCHGGRRGDYRAPSCGRRGGYVAHPVVEANHAVEEPELSRQAQREAEEACGNRSSRQRPQARIGQPGKRQGRWPSERSAGAGRVAGPAARFSQTRSPRTARECPARRRAWRRKGARVEPRPENQGAERRPNPAAAAPGGNRAPRHRAAGSARGSRRSRGLRAAPTVAASMRCMARDHVASGIAVTATARGCPPRARPASSEHPPAEDLGDHRHRLRIAPARLAAPG